MTAPAWLYDDPETGYHDRSCGCVGHCGNCLADLATIRRDQQKLIDAGKLDRKDKLDHRRRYCCDYCQGRAKRERAFDRYLASGGRR